MATRQDKLRMLTRYYTPRKAERILRGRGDGTSRPWIVMDAYERDDNSNTSRKYRALVKQLRRTLLARRKRGEYAAYTTQMYQLLREYSGREEITQAFARDWNNLLGQTVIMRCPWDQSRHIMPPLAERDASGFVEAIGFKPNKPPAEENIIKAWTRKRWCTALTHMDGPVLYISSHTSATGRYQRETHVARRYDDDVLIDSLTCHPLLLARLGYVVHTLGELAPTGHGIADAFWDTQDTASPTGALYTDQQIAIDPLDSGAMEVAVAYAARRTRGTVPRIQMQGRHTSHAYIAGVDATGPGEWNLGLEWETAVQHNARTRHYIDRNPRAAAHIGNAGNAREVSVLQTLCAFRRASGVNSYVHAEHDGTIPDGYELVFGYRSLGEHKRLFNAAVEVDAQHPWIDTMQTSYQAGIHVHVGRFSHDRNMTVQSITAMANLVHWSENRSFINAIARRNISATSYIHVPSTRSRDGRLGLSNNRISAKLQTHYAPLNVRGATVELRIFASGGVNEALEALEWGEALACYSLEMCNGSTLAHTSKTRLHWTRIVDYVRSDAERWPYANARTHTSVVLDLIAAYKLELAHEATVRDEVRRARQAARALPAMTLPQVPDDDFNADEDEDTQVYLDSAVDELMQA